MPTDLLAPSAALSRILALTVDGFLQLSITHVLGVLILV